MDIKKRPTFVVASTAVTAILLLCLGIANVLKPGVRQHSTHSALIKNGTAVIPEDCSFTKEFRVLFSHRITICLLEDQVYIHIGYYDEGTIGGQWFTLHEWKNLVRQLPLIKPAISDIKSHG